MIRLCIFDLDGTISNTLRSLHYFCSAALEQCGFPPVEDEDAVRRMVGSGARTLIKRLITASLGEDHTEEQYEQLFKTYSELNAADPMKLVTEYDGMRDLLSTLQEQGILLAVLSNKNDALTKRVVAALYPEIRFAAARGQMEGFPKKPAPDGVFAILDALSVRREEALYIGDSDVDMNTGRNAGLRTIGVTWGFRTPEELLAIGCDGLIDHPSELLDIIAQY